MGAEATTIRVLCVDDHPLLRQGIGAPDRRQPDMELVAQARNGREGLAAVPPAPPGRDAAWTCACPT